MTTHSPMTGEIDIFCVGDSTTEGFTSSGPQPFDSYRLALSNAIQADIGGPIPNTVSFNFVGPFNFGNPPSNQNAAINGANCTVQFPAMLTSCPFVTGAQVVVIVQMGLDDATQLTLPVFPLNYLSLIRRIHNLLRDKNPRFIFGLLNSAWNPSLVSPYNAALPALWAELQREGIEFETMSWDWISADGGNAHPTQVEYNGLGANDIPGECYHLAFRKLIGYP